MDLRNNDVLRSIELKQTMNNYCENRFYHVTTMNIIGLSGVVWCMA